MMNPAPAQPIRQSRRFGRRGRGSREGGMGHRADGRVSGTYVHGLFADDRQRALWLGRLGAAPGPDSYESGIEAVLDRLAAHLERHVDCDRLLGLAGRA